MIISTERLKPQECGRRCVICGPDVCSQNCDFDEEVEDPKTRLVDFGKAVESVSKELDELFS